MVFRKNEDVIMDFPGDLPGNSHTARMNKGSQENEEPEETKTSEASETTPGTKEVKKVIQGKVTQRKKPLGTRVKDMFASDNGDSFGQYLVDNVVVPMLKDMVLSVITQTADGIRGGIEERLFGSTEQRSTRTTSYGTGRPVNYTRYSSSSAGRPTTRPTTPAPRIMVRRSNKIQDLFFESRDDADAVIEELSAVVDSMGHCTVGDLYGLVGEPINQVDQSWGWDDLRDARVRLIPSTGQFLLVMPRPIEIAN